MFKENGDCYGLKIIMNLLNNFFCAKISQLNQEYLLSVQFFHSLKIERIKCICGRESFYIKD